MSCKAVQPLEVACFPGDVQVDDSSEGGKKCGVGASGSQLEDIDSPQIASFRKLLKVYEKELRESLGWENVQKP